MRSDMAKVIVERPRYGSRLSAKKKGYRKYLQKVGVESLPRHEPMKGRWHGMNKFFNEHLGPMRRFLRSRIGRPWNTIHHELCENIDLGNVVQKHVMTHVYQYVERYVEDRDGTLIRCDGYGRSLPLREGQMYVCPRTGILRIVKRAIEHVLPKRICRSGTCQYHFRDGGWWEVKVRELPLVAEEQWDCWLERAVVNIALGEREAAYGGKLWAISKRLLSPSETRALLKSIRNSK